MGIRTTMSQEDYLETILDLSSKSPEVKSVDVARIRSVSRASVNKALSGLVEAGFVEHEPYSKITLTKKGKKIAKEIRERHDLLAKFLVDVLKVDPKIADDEACRMEHVISVDTTKKLYNYLKSIK
ncbi:MAG: Fur family transcriptional regulator [Treponema sp.]|nr:MAG: Fur family transcriptional regulator [Treponema sp.]